MYRVPSPNDPLVRESREIERRRERFEDRRKRILHAKTRVLGIDKDELELQVQEREDAERKEKERDLYFDDVTVAHARQLSELERQRALANQRRAQELQFYRSQQVALKQQEDEVKRTSLPPLADSPTPFLAFDGVDAEAAERRRLQQQQQSEWLHLQLQTKAEEEQNIRDEEKRYDEQQKAILAIQLQQINQQQQNNLERKVHQQTFNQMLLDERRIREREEEMRRRRAEEEEVHNMLTSPFLNENYGPEGRTRMNSGYAFKGFLPGQYQQIYETRINQIEEHRNSKSEEVKEENNWANESERQRRLLVIMDKQKHRNQSRENLKQVEANKQIHAVKQARDSYLTNVVYTNPVSEEYFEQFGTSCR